MLLYSGGCLLVNEYGLLNLFHPISMNIQEKYTQPMNTCIKTKKIYILFRFLGIGNYHNLTQTPTNTISRSRG